MPPPRDPSQTERCTQAKSKGLKKDISCKCKRKRKAGSSICIGQNRL